VGQAALSAVVFSNGLGTIRSPGVALGKGDGSASSPNSLAARDGKGWARLARAAPQGALDGAPPKGSRSRFDGRSVQMRERPDDRSTASRPRAVADARGLDGRSVKIRNCHRGRGVLVIRAFAGGGSTTGRRGQQASTRPPGLPHCLEGADGFPGCRRPNGSEQHPGP